MGTHGAAGAKARAVTVGNRANKSTDASPGASRFLNLSNWPVSRRLFAVIVLALVMGLVFGGLRISSAESSASQFGRVSQLATLGQRLTLRAPAPLVLGVGAASAWWVHARHITRGVRHFQGSVGSGQARAERGGFDPVLA